MISNTSTKGDFYYRTYNLKSSALSIRPFLVSWFSILSLYCQKCVNSKGFFLLILMVYSSFGLYFIWENPFGVRFSDKQNILKSE